MSSFSPNHSLDVGRNLRWPGFRWPGATAAVRRTTRMVALRTAAGEICRAQAPPLGPDGGRIGYHAELTTMKVASYVA